MKRRLGNNNREWFWRRREKSEESKTEREGAEERRDQLKVRSRQSSISRVSVYSLLDLTRDLVAYACAPGIPETAHLARQRQGGRLGPCPRALLLGSVIYLKPSLTAKHLAEPAGFPSALCLSTITVWMCVCACASSVFSKFIYLICLFVFLFFKEQCLFPICCKFIFNFLWEWQNNAKPMGSFSIKSKWCTSLGERVTLLADVFHQNDIVTQIYDYIFLLWKDMFKRRILKFVFYDLILIVKILLRRRSTVYQSCCLFDCWLLRNRSCFKSYWRDLH